MSYQTLRWEITKSEGVSPYDDFVCAGDEEQMRRTFALLVAAAL